MYLIFALRKLSSFLIGKIAVLFLNSAQTRNGGATGVDRDIGGQALFSVGTLWKEAIPNDGP
jgi:hypothetical protein